MNPYLARLEALRGARAPHTHAAADLLEQIKAVVLEMFEEDGENFASNIRQIHLASGISRQTIYTWVQQTEAHKRKNRPRLGRRA